MLSLGGKTKRRLGMRTGSQPRPTVLSAHAPGASESV